MSIIPGELGMKWPGGSYKVIAWIEVDENWLLKKFGRDLAKGIEDGLGPWVAIGGVLPSGQMIEAVKYTLSPAEPLRFELRSDEMASHHEVLEEFVIESGIERCRVSATSL